jgi:hypothetical protein
MVDSCPNLGYIHKAKIFLNVEAMQGKEATAIKANVNIDIAHK